MAHGHIRHEDVDGSGKGVDTFVQSMIFYRPIVSCHASIAKSL